MTYCSMLYLAIISTQLEKFEKANGRAMQIINAGNRLTTEHVEKML